MTTMTDGRCQARMGDVKCRKHRGHSGAHDFPKGGRDG